MSPLLSHSKPHVGATDLKTKLLRPGKTGYLVAVEASLAGGNQHYTTLLVKTYSSRLHFHQVAVGIVGKKETLTRVRTRLEVCPVARAGHPKTGGLVVQIPYPSNLALCMAASSQWCINIFFIFLSFNFCAMIHLLPVETRCFPTTHLVISYTTLHVNTPAC